MCGPRTHQGHVSSFREILKRLELQTLRVSSQLVVYDSTHKSIWEEDDWLRVWGKQKLKKKKKEEKKPLLLEICLQLGFHRCCIQEPPGIVEIRFPPPRQPGIKHYQRRIQTAVLNEIYVYVKVIIM